MSGTASNTNPCDVIEATPEEGRSLFDKASKDALGISGEEFLSRYDGGLYDDTDDPAVAGVAMLIPFAR
ncbi:hypothetical protein IMZ11_02150 [Microtetraspora sp. AC03309]|uniref:hypothetical protein n=1 Tax=Microtetraspora sp. AC03309 TaxID=2779376 RepID=UPI001E536FCC|nr:hypothetical protein [Microtetraspora sp. AC03309]MCC5574442.1 hypothetical protein [Microtetraspora sp. AC03309]